VPKAPTDSLLIILGLIGTTVVPYNLFLHASLVKEKWHDVSDFALARRDTFIAMITGGIGYMAIIISATASNTISISNLLKSSNSLE